MRQLKHHLSGCWDCYAKQNGTNSLSHIVAETVKRCVEQAMPPTEQRKEKSKM